MMELYYWKDYQQREIDFVLKYGPQVQQLIQVSAASASHDIDKREYAALLKGSEQLRCNNLLILTWDYEAKETIDKKEIQCIPLWKWLLGFT